MIDFLKNLSMIESFSLLFAIIFIGRIVIKEVITIIFYRKMLKKAKEEQVKMEANKCKGPHSWIDIPVIGENTHVCKDCYWSPKHEGFVRKSFVDEHLHKIRYKEEMEQYKQDRLDGIAATYMIDPTHVEDVYNSMISIVKDFNIQYLDKKIKEMISDKED